MISVTIYEEELLRFSACSDGIKLFRQLATPSKSGRMRVRVVDWTPLHAIWLRVAYPGFAGWLQARGLIPAANLRAADLSGTDLRFADLYGSDLTCARLRGSSLRGADLRGADLRGAILVDANLYGADLRGADLRGADLRGADLRGALWTTTSEAPRGWCLGTSGLLVRGGTQ
jgi:hypothetical protein